MLYTLKLKNPMPAYTVFRFISIATLNLKPPGQLFYAEIGRAGGMFFFYFELHALNHMLQ